MDTQSLQGPRIALLIDFDNVILGVEEPPGFDIELVVTALRSRGRIVLGRAYGDWYRHNRHRRRLMDHGIELVETPAFGPIIKNSADIRIALDAFEIGMTQDHITEFCLVSGDSDFLPLIKRLQYLGKTVTVISGVKFTSDLVRRNCNEFISYENLLAESVGAAEDATVLEGAFALLIRTIHTLNERGMEVRSSTVKQMMIQLNPVFSERTFGCTQFKQFLDKACRAGLICLGRRDSNSGEYTVLLADENGDDSDDIIVEPEKAERGARRGRGRRTQSSKEDQVPEEAEKTEPEEETVDEKEADEKTSDEKTSPASGASRAALAREALRQGRLRSSGRTWKGKTATRSILQGALNGANAASEVEAAEDADAAETTEETPATPIAVTDTVTEISDSQNAISDTETSENSSSEKEKAKEERAPVKEEKAENQAEAEPSLSEPEDAQEKQEADKKASDLETEEPVEKPKRTTRHRKTTRKAAEETEEAAAEDSGESESKKKPAKKRASKAASKSTKKAPAAKSAAKAKEEIADESQASSEATEQPEEKEEKKAAKKPVRRRTPRKKQEDAPEKASAEEAPETPKPETAEEG